MPKYKAQPIEDLREALAFKREILDGRTKEARKLKQINRALNESFDDALKELLEYSISINVLLEKQLVDKGLEEGNLEMSQELKAIRKDTMDRMKLLEKLNKGRKLTKDEDSLAKMILSGENE